MPDLTFTEAELDRLADALAPRLAARMTPRADPSGALLTKAAAAKRLGVSPKTVTRRIADGSLAAVIDHGKTKVRAADLADYVERLERVGSRSAPRRAPRARDYAFLRD